MLKQDDWAAVGCCRSIRPSASRPVDRRIRWSLLVKYPGLTPDHSRTQTAVVCVLTRSGIGAFLARRSTFGRSCLTFRRSAGLDEAPLEALNECSRMYGRWGTSCSARSYSTAPMVSWMDPIAHRRYYSAAAAGIEGQIAQCSDWMSGE